MSFNWLRKRWAPVLLALGSLVVMGAVACGGGEDPTATTAPTGTTPTVAPTTASTGTPSSGTNGTPSATATSQPATAVATTPPSGNTGAPSGSLIRAFTTLEAIYGIGYTGPYRTSATNQIGGVEERLFVYENGNPMTPFMADSWSIDPAGTKVTITLKKNIPFYSPVGFEDVDFGQLDAPEVVEWLNRSNSTTNAESTYGDAGDFAAVFLEAKVVDQYTLEIGLVTPVYFCVPLSQFGCLSADRGPTKVTTVESMGLEWARAHHIGNGPYVQGDDCVAGDRCSVHAVSNHWNKTGEVADITGIQVPESQTQIAMLKNGSIDMAEIDYSLLPDIVDQTNFRFLETMPGGYVTQSVIFSGNLWEEEHARTREPLNPWDSPVYAKDYPWLGDPWQQIHPENVKYTDDNNPAGMTDMEQARLVRLALSMAIDRDGINQNLLNGIGQPIYSEYMGPEYPGWDPSAVTPCFDVDGNEVPCTGTMEGIPWKLDTNLQRAGELLDMAGYPLVNGQRQGFETITLNAYAAEAGPVDFEVANAIMSDWNRIGVPTQGLIEDYGGVISPRMRTRTQFNPVFKNGDVHSNVYPLDWPMPTVDTSSSRPGFGVGFESPAGARWLFEILGESDPQVREQKHVEWVNYSLFWVQYAGTFEVPKGLVVNSRIESWNGRQQHYSNISSDPEFIVLAD